MRLVTEARERLRALFFRSRQEEELDEEVRTHLEMEAEARVREGLDPAEARRQAAITFGAIDRVKEEVRDARGLGLVDDFVRDLGYAIRRVGGAPLTPLLVVLSLAIGIAVTTSMFSALDAFLLRPLPFADADRIVRVSVRDPAAASEDGNVSASTLELLREQARGINLAAFQLGGMNLRGDDAPERIETLRVSGNFFDVLGPAPLLGRTSFSPAEENGDVGGVIIISETLWARHFGRGSQALGGVLHLDGQPHSVIGVVPNESLFPHHRVHIYTPLRRTDDVRGNEAELAVIGRLRPGVSVDAAAVELKRIYSGSVRIGAGSEGFSVALTRLDRAMFNQSFRTGAAICFVAVVFVLLIACSNAANLLLARAATRQHEMAVRAALGAGRGRLVRQLLTESLVLSLAAGAVGVAATYWALKGLIAMMPADVPMVGRIALDERALLVALGVSMLAGIVSGAVPALHDARRGVGSVAQGGRWAIGGNEQATRLRSSIVVLQIALALVLLIGAGLLIKGYVRAIDAHPGFAKDDLLTIRVSLPALEGRDPRLTAETLATMEEQARRVPGVQRIALADALPMMRGGTGVRYVTSQSRDDGSASQPAAELRSVSPGYFETLQIGLAAGRLFSDERHTDPPVVVINATLARAGWVDSSPVGDYMDYGGRRARIIGVVDDVHEWGMAVPPPPLIYAPLAQRPVESVVLAVRSGVPVEFLLPRLREAIARVDDDVPLTDVATMNTVIRLSQPRNRLLVRVLGIFASVAAVLAVLGVYGVMTYDVTRRRSEVGIRTALGARSIDVLGLMLRHAGTLAGAGVLIGLAVALAVTRFLASFLNGVSPFDLVVFGGVAGLLFSAGLVACLIPAARAARVSPLTALRSE